MPIDAVSFNPVSTAYPRAAASGETEPADGKERENGAKTDDAKSAPGKTELTPDQKKEVLELKKIDRATRAHEQAHMAAAGGAMTHGATYTWRLGPDGKRYAVSGEVGIDVSAEKTPEATIRKMQQIRAAALAPADPSGQDRAVAAEAQALAAAARMELQKDASEKAIGNSTESKTEETPSIERVREGIDIVV